MEFVDFGHPRHHQTSDPKETMVPAYYENVMHQLNFNPALVVVALTGYVLLVLLGMLTNCRVISVIRKRFQGISFTFDIRLAEMDVLALCAANLVTILCFIFVIFDMVYGQWMLPSQILCKLYLSAEGFTRILSGMVLLHLIFLCAYFLRKSTSGSPISTGLLSKMVIHYVYVWIICPVFALVFSLVVYQHADIHYLDSHLDSENETESTELETCVLIMSNEVATWLTIYGSIWGYLAPLSTFILASMLCRCRCRGISDIPIGRYVSLVTNYGILFFLCHTPAWVMSIYDYTDNTEDPSSPDPYNPLTFLNYFIQTISYLPCVGYPVLYLHSISVNRVSIDESRCSDETRRDETVVTLVSGQRAFDRELSRDGLLNNRPSMRARTMSNLHRANTDTIITLAVHRRASYHTLPDSVEMEDRL